MSNDPAVLYRQLAEIPRYSAAAFIESGDNVSIVRATSWVRDHTRNIRRTFVKSITLAGDAVYSSLPQETDAVASIVSPSGQRIAILKEVPGDDAKKKRFVEVWDGQELVAIKEVTKIHGEFYHDDLISSLAFAPSETALLYTAEANPPTEDDDSDPLAKYRFEPSFGEQYIGKRRPTIFLFRFASPKPTVTQIKPSIESQTRITFAQASFSADEQSFYATGYEITSDGRKLGLAFCVSRPSGIWEIALPSDADLNESATVTGKQLFNSQDRASRSPRFFAKFGSLVWLSHSARGPHSSCGALHIQPKDGDSKVLVNVVHEAPKNEFPGLYLDVLPSRPFLLLNDEPYLITHSLWGSRRTVLLISLVSGKLRDLTPDDGKLFSWLVLGTDGKSKVLVTRTAPAVPNEVLLGQVGDNGKIQWKVLDKPKLSSNVESALNSLSASIVQIPDRFPTETIVVQPKADRVLPLITIPHGGPHAISTTEFNPSGVALAMEGYTLSYPNYTGSLGFGQKWILELPGKCGSLDVQDVIESVRHLIRLGIADEGKGRQFVQGGSHGGFLGTHLVGQFPRFFSAVVLRNPVTSAGEMTATTDIPDFSYAEHGFAYNPSQVLTPEFYAPMFKASPVAHIDAIETPVLLLMGDIDQRVPPSQGKNYYHFLKARGKEVEMLVFEGNGHALDKVEAEKVGWEAAREFMARFVKK